jgi:hypothetical protein
MMSQRSQTLRGPLAAGLFRGTLTLWLLGAACGGASDPPGGSGGGQGSGGALGGQGGAAGKGGAGGSGGATSGACVPDYACKPVSPNTGDVYADCVARVNQFRACVCLPPLPRWSAGEACADQDAQYDSQQNSAHAGFQAGICTSGNAQDECPNWGKTTPEKVIDGCLQMMFDEGPPPSGTCTGQCYSDHGHYINMTGTKYTASGGIWAVQNFQ